MFRQEEDTPDGWRALTFYQLGAVLHDMLMNQRLFSKFAYPFARLVEAVKYEIPRIETADVPPDLVLLANNCLLKDPQLRLRMVKWEDFEPRGVSPASAAEAKERIRKRQVQVQEGLPPRGDLDADRNAWELRRTVERIKAKVEEIIREEILSGGLFPPMELHESQTQASERVEFLARFAPSTPHALPHFLEICFTVVLLEQKALTIQLECYAAIYRSPEQAKPDRPPLSLSFFQGVFEESVIRSRLRDMLYPLLDRAQQVELPASKQRVWLEVEIPQKGLQGQ